MATFLQSLLGASLCCVTVCGGAEEEPRWFHESLYPDWQQQLRMDHILKEEKTEFQDLAIFQNEHMGTVLALDGIVQTTEADEFVYHEMMTHVPLIAHGNAKNVLIIGGGDGGILREVSRHKGVEKIVMVEIDSSVIELSKEYLPTLSNGAFLDPRLELILADGARYVSETEERFDVVICDSPDPIGPAEILFGQEFYANCKRVLKEKGIFVNQNGVPFMQASEVTNSFHRRQPHFVDVSFYVTPVPTYVGGLMTLGWATDEMSYRKLPVEEIEFRLAKIEGEMKYYNAEIHHACFALPNYIKAQFNQN